MADRSNEPLIKNPVLGWLVLLVCVLVIFAVAYAVKPYFVG